MREKRVSEIEAREKCRELRDESFGVLRDWEKHSQRKHRID